MNTARTRAKNLEDKDIETIVGILDGWSGQLKWESLIEEIEKQMHQQYTRQALSKHVRIKEAFNFTKERLTKVTMIRSVGPSGVDALLQRLDRLENENVRLQKENHTLLEQFARWSYNSYVKGISFSDLDKPLPKTDRGQD